MFRNDQNVEHMSQVVRTLLDQKKQYLGALKPAAELWQEVRKSFSALYPDYDLCFAITEGIVKWRILQKTGANNGMDANQDQCDSSTLGIGGQKGPQETVGQATQIVVQNKNPEQEIIDQLVVLKDPPLTEVPPPKACVTPKPRWKKNWQPWTPVTTSKGKKRKRPIPAYCYFFSEERKKLVLEMPDLPNSELSREIGARWRSLGDDERQVYLLQQQQGLDQFLAGNLNGNNDEDEDDDDDDDEVIFGEDQKRAKRQRRPTKFYEDADFKSQGSTSQEKKPGGEVASTDQRTRLREKTPARATASSSSSCVHPSSTDANDLSNYDIQPAEEMEQKFFHKTSAKLREVCAWTSEQVANFVSTISGCDKYAGKFIEEEIDGVAFTELSRQDLMMIGLKLGPAIKVHLAILSMKRE